MELIHFGVVEQETEALAVPKPQSSQHHGSNLTRVLLTQKFNPGIIG
jgi:hypothetical protein